MASLAIHPLAPLSEVPLSSFLPIMITVTLNFRPLFVTVLACACPSNPGRSRAPNLGDDFVFCVVLVGGDVVALREVVALPLDGLNHRFVDADGFRVVELFANA